MLKKVLVYDDEEPILDICNFVLTAKGWEVITSQSCSDVISDIEKVKPDIVIMDHWIPGIKGSEAAQLIKSHPEFKYIPVILFTAVNDVEILAKKAKADAFITKPFDLNMFEKTVENALRKISKT